MPYEYLVASAIATRSRPSRMDPLLGWLAGVPACVEKGLPKLSPYFDPTQNPRSICQMPGVYDVRPFPGTKKSPLRAMCVFDDRRCKARECFVKSVDIISCENGIRRAGGHARSRTEKDTIVPIPRLPRRQIASSFPVPGTMRCWRMTICSGRS